MNGLTPMRGRSVYQWLARFAVAALAALLPAAGECQTGPGQGFGAATLGGANGALARVTNLRDSGPGSLREALSGGNRTIVFDVAGEIALRTFLYVLGAHVTIDGLSAPAPGITLSGYGLIIRGNRGAHDVIVRGIRVRRAAVDGIQVAGGAFNVLIDRVSVTGSVDGNIDITENARDVTVSWSILGANAKNMLVKYGASRITLHHNVLAASTTRSPQIRIDDTTTAVATETIADIRNNVVANWGTGYGTIVWYGPRANIVNNYYTAAGDALTVKKARAWVSGNHAPGRELRVKGTELGPFDAPAVETQEACAAAALTLAGAGVRPLDATDQHLLSIIAAPSCGKVPPVLAAGMPSLAFHAVDGGPHPGSQTVSIAEARSQAVAWTAASSQSWLTVSPRAGTTPTSVTVTTHATGLGPGTHAAEVTVRPRGGPALSIPVVLIVVPPPSDALTLRVEVAHGGDDGRQDAAGVARLREKLLPVGEANLVALRFADVGIPQGAVIGSAVLGLIAVNRSALNTPLDIRYRGEAAGDSAPLAEGRGSLGSRATTQASVEDNPAEWVMDHPNVSPDLAAIIQEIVGHPGWESGNALTLFLEDAGSEGKRIIGSRDDRAARAAVLTIRYWSP